MVLGNYKGKFGFQGYDALLMNRLFFRFLLTLGIFLLALNTSRAQQNFVYHYDLLVKTDVQLAEAPNGDVVMAGTVDEEIYCVRYYPTGDIRWSRMLDVSRQVLFGDVTVDDQGRTLLTYAEGNPVKLVRLDKAGQVTLDKAYNINANATSTLTPEDIWNGPDGNYYLYGYYQFDLAPRPFLLKTDAGGEVLEAQGYSTPKDLNGRARKTSDGGALVVQDSFLFKTNAAGKVSWSKGLNTNYNQVKNMEVLENGQAVIMLTTSNQNKFMVIKVDKKGNLRWQTKRFQYPGLGKIEVSGMTLTPESGVLISGRVNTEGAVPRNLPTLVKIWPDGHFDYIQYFRDTASPSPLYSGAYALLRSDNEEAYYLAGKKSFDPNKTKQMVFIKANSLDTANDCISKLDYKTAPMDKLTIEPNTLTAKPLDIQADNYESGFRQLTITPDVVCFACVYPEVDLGPDTGICQGDSLTLDTRIRRTRHIWSTGAESQAITVDQSGRYWVQVSNSCGESTDTVRLTVYADTEGGFSIGPRQPDPQQPVTFTDSLPQTIDEEWFFGDSSSARGAQISHTYDTVGRYAVTLQYADENGCRYQLHDTLEVFSYSLYMPNAFSPNDDGMNETFQPVGFGINKYSLVIYNRWGERVFEGNGEGWDGHFKGRPAPPGIYVYELRVRNVYRNMFNQTGTVRLVR